VLTLRNLSTRKNRGKVLWSLEEASLPPDGIVLLIGRNGAGKSTLLRIIIGLVRGYSGEVLWHTKQGEGRSSQIGYVPEFPVVVPGVTAREWIAWYHGIDPATLTDALPDYFVSSGFSAAHLLDRKLTELSKGELQIVQIWQQFLVPPAVGVFDEPFSGLDPWHKQKLLGALHAMADHMVLLVSTHEIPPLLRERARAVWFIDPEELKLKVLSPEESPI
jgi:ABC-type multidrug transport system ATPase subunit